MTSASQTLQGIVALAAGANHSAAIDQNGNVWTWGSNTTGQLGNGDASGTAQSYPVQVSSVSNVVTVAAGATNTFALEENGQVYAWGSNTMGQLGNGMMGSAINANPSQVHGLSNITSISNQFAVDAADNVWAWGDNTDGRLGLGAQGNDATAPLELTFYSGTAPTVADTSGNNQTVNWNQYQPLTVTVTNGGSPVANTLVNFTLTQGGGELATSSSGMNLGGIVQVMTNSQGVATIYFQEASSGSGSSQVVAESDNGQSLFTLINSGVGVPNLPRWGYLLVGILILAAMSKFLPSKGSRMVS
jgi:hypothetical protein